MDFIRPNLPFFGVMTSYIGGRKENQDTCGYSETERGLLVVVCDGMGGGPGGKTASRIAVETIVSYVQQSCVAEQAPATADTNVETAEAPAPEAEVTEAPDITPEANEKILHQAVEAANTALRNRILVEPKLNGMGTTVTAMIINSEGAALAHVGDSRIYQLHDKKIIFRTADHSEVGKMVRNGILTEEQARLSAMSNIITRALGIGDTVEVETTTRTFVPGDRFVLCTDGVWGSMPQPELVKLFTKKGDLETTVRKINTRVEEAGIEKGGHHDNFSMIMVMTTKASEAPATDEGANSAVKGITGEMPRTGSRGGNLSPKIIASAAVLLFIVGLGALVLPRKSSHLPENIQSAEATVGADIANPDTASVNNPGIIKTAIDALQTVNSTETGDPSGEPVNTEEQTPDEPSATGTPPPNTPVQEQTAPATPPEDPNTLLPDYREGTPIATNSNINPRVRIEYLTATVRTLNFVKKTMESIEKARFASAQDDKRRDDRKAMRDSLKLLDRKYKVFYNDSEHHDLFHEEESGTNQGLLGALGQKLISSLIDKNKKDQCDQWQGAYNTIMEMTDSLLNMFTAQLEEAQKELKDSNP